MCADPKVSSSSHPCPGEHRKLIVGTLGWKLDTISLNQNLLRLQNRSFMSDLSDIPDNPQEEDQDFHEGLKKVHDAVFPGFTSPMSGEKIPTHLIPYDVLKGSPLKRHLKN